MSITLKIVLTSLIAIFFGTASAIIVDDLDKRNRPFWSENVIVQRIEKFVAFNIALVVLIFLKGIWET